MPNDISSALKSLSVDDLSIDNQGRVVIDNAQIANLLRREATLKLDPAAADNVACCENLARCGKTTAPDVIDIKQRLVQQRSS